MAMTTNLKAIASAMVLGATLLIGPAASAHDWRGYSGGFGFNGSFGDPRDTFLVQSTCSGESGYRVQNRLNRAIQNGSLERWTARRIQRDIDRLRGREAHECREGDFRSARKIGQEYIRVRDWIDTESSWYGPGWHRR